MFFVGIGKETARVLALRGAQVFCCCRDESKGQAAVAEILRLTNLDAEKVQFMSLNLSSFESVRNFATAFLEKNLPLHMLILNAGVMAADWGLTTEGFETTFGVNHLAHFLLTSLLIEKLKASAPARVVVLASEAHRMGDEGLLTLVKEEKNYSAWKAYGQAKLANVLFALELNRRLAGTGVTANAVHPGVINTELSRSSFVGRIFYTAGSVFLKTIPQGAATTCYVATNPAITHETSGKYYADSNISKTTAYGENVDLAERLWTLSEEQTGTTFLKPVPAAATQ